jgi:signal transduction histidine kinase
VVAEVDRLTRLVGDLLLLAQAESGRLPLDVRPVELDTILLEVFQQMRTLAGEKLQLHIEAIDQVQVAGDRDRLKQVLVNLAGNAVQYTPAGGKVTFRLEKYQEQARLFISDTGPGIPTQDLPHIFERFYRGERSRKRPMGGQSSGFGLGLSIAYWIVRNHGGSIEVDSRQGQGTTFCIWLPILPPPPPQMRQKPENQSICQPKLFAANQPCVRKNMGLSKRYVWITPCFSVNAYFLSTISAAGDWYHHCFPFEPPFTGGRALIERLW